MKLNDFLIAFGLYILFLLISIIFVDRGYFIIYSSVNLIFILFIFQDFRWLSLDLYVLLCLLFIGTFSSVFILKINFSYFQILRSQGWFLVAILNVRVANMWFRKLNYRNFKKVLNVISGLIVLLSFFVIVFKLNGAILFPYEIITRDDNQSRIYVLGFGSLLPLIVLFYREKKYLSFLSGLYLISISIGKIGILYIFLVVFYIVIYEKFTLIRGFYFLVVAFLISIVYLNVLADRTQNFFENGDLRRLQQVNESYEKFNTNFITRLVGIGIGTEYGTGYGDYVYNPRAEKDQESLYINSRYDIENGYMFLLSRFGIIGSLIIVWILFFKNFDLFFFLYSLIFFLSGSPVGPGFAVSIIAFVFLHTSKKHYSNSIKI